MHRSSITWSIVLDDNHEENGVVSYILTVLNGNSRAKNCTLWNSYLSIVWEVCSTSLFLESWISWTFSHWDFEPFGKAKQIVCECFKYAVETDRMYVSLIRSNESTSNHFHPQSLLIDSVLSASEFERFDPVCPQYSILRQFTVELYLYCQAALYHSFTRLTRNLLAHFPSGRSFSGKGEHLPLKGLLYNSLSNSSKPNWFLKSLSLHALQNRKHVVSANKIPFLVRYCFSLWPDPEVQMWLHITQSLISKKSVSICLSKIAAHWLKTRLWADTWLYSEPLSKRMSIFKMESRPLH